MATAVFTTEEQARLDVEREKELQERIQRLIHSGICQDGSTPSNIVVNISPEIKLGHEDLIPAILAIPTDKIVTDPPEGDPSAHHKLLRDLTKAMMLATEEPIHSGFKTSDEGLTNDVVQSLNKLVSSCQSKSPGSVSEDAWQGIDANQEERKMIMALAELGDEDQVRQILSEDSVLSEKVEMYKSNLIQSLAASTVGSVIESAVGSVQSSIGSTYPDEVGPVRDDKTGVEQKDELSVESAAEQVAPEPTDAKAAVERAATTKDEVAPQPTAAVSRAPEPTAKEASSGVQSPSRKSEVYKGNRKNPEQIVSSNDKYAAELTSMYLKMERKIEKVENGKGLGDVKRQWNQKVSELTEEYKVENPAQALLMKGAYTTILNEKVDERRGQITKESRKQNSVMPSSPKPQRQTRAVRLQREAHIAATTSIHKRREQLKESHQEIERQGPRGPR